jgi:hypothetical protein
VYGAPLGDVAVALALAAPTVCCCDAFTDVVDVGCIVVRCGDALTGAWPRAGCGGVPVDARPNAD